MKLSIRELVNGKQALVHGRTAGIINKNKVSDQIGDGAVNLFWTGSALEFNVTGSCFSVTFYSDYACYEQWIAVFVNGAFVQRLMLDKGLHTVKAFRNLSPEKVKNVRLVKEVQAMSDDREALLLGVSAETDGEFREIGERKLKLEFIGDSITSGEGTIGAKKEEDWVPMVFSASNSYSFMTAKALGADYRVVSQSGWGLLCGWDANPYHSLAEHYTRVCSLLQGEKQRQCGCDLCYDFASWQPDFVILNLGTNDCSAFEQPEWKGENGESFRLRKEEDGSFNKEDVQLWTDAADRFLNIIRNNNPKAQIIWAFGMLGHSFVPVIEGAIRKYCGRTGDEKVRFLLLPDTTDETVGSRYHPGIKSHENAAKALIEEIQKML